MSMPLANTEPRPTPPPVALPVRAALIPASLRELPGWVTWRYALRSGKWTKPPTRADGKGLAKVNDPATWASFDAAAAAGPQGGAGGIGMVLTADLVGVDLDHVLDLDTGDLEPWAAEVLTRFAGCYVERSPGGDGLHIFCRGAAVRSGKGGPGNRCEVYDKSSPRYLTVTGHRWGDGDVIEAQAALDWLHATLMAKAEAAPKPAGNSVAADDRMQAPATAPPVAPNPQPAAHSLSDDEVIRKAHAARNGGKFFKLWTGDAGKDASAADAALVGALAFFTQDAGQIDRLFRQSRLMRPKWDEDRAGQTYGALTIGKVLAMPGARYSGPSTSAEPQARAAAPALIPLPPELLPVQPFPLDALPDAFRPWVADVSERMQCPPDFVAVPLLVAAASLVARRVAIQPQERTDWTERGNLWALIVGRPGMMKSPSMAAALAPLKRLEAQAAEHFNAADSEHRAAAIVAGLVAKEGLRQASAKLKQSRHADVSHLVAEPEQDPAPVRARYIVNDLTYEKLGQVLAENPDGVLLERDEMNGLLRKLSGEDEATARGFYLQAWSGGAYTFDRIGRGTVTIPDARLSIVGGIQPGPLSRLVREARSGIADDGMTERFLIAWPDDPGDWREVDRCPDTAAKRRAWEVFTALDVLSPGAMGAVQATDAMGEPYGLPLLRFDDNARASFADWRAGLMARLRADGDGLAGALSKFTHHVPALALALHAIDGGSGPVTLAPTLKALMLAEYFESHARRLHGSGRSEVIRAARGVLVKARAGSLTEPFTARDVYRNQWTGLSEPKTVADALDMLAAHGWLLEATEDTGGRPSVVYRLSDGARGEQVG